MGSEEGGGRGWGKNGCAGLVDGTSQRESRRGTGNKTPQPNLPIMHNPVWTVFSKNMSIDFTNICMCNYNVHVSVKNFLYSVFKYSQPTYIYCVFLPLKRMSCMSHFGTLHRKKKKEEERLVFVCLFFCSGRNHVPESVQTYYSMSFFFFFFYWFLLEEVSVNAQRTNIFNTTIATSTTVNTD